MTTEPAGWEPKHSLVDYSLLTYLGGGALLLAYGALHEHRPALMGVAVVHMLAALVILGLRKSDWTAVHLLYPAILVPALRAELSTLNRILWPVYFDPLLEQADISLFGSTPASWLSGSFPSAVLSEALHFAYLSSLFLAPLLLASVVWKSYRRFQETAFTLTSVLLLTHAANILFPVQGPRLAPLVQALHGPLWELSQTFPSPSLTLAWSAALACWRLFPRVGPLALAWALLASLGALYGRFDYAVDVVAAFLLALAGDWLGPATFQQRCPLWEADEEEEEP